MALRIKPPPFYVRRLDPLRLLGALRGDCDPIVRFVKIKLTNQCNLRCVKCNFWRRADRVNSTPLSRFLAESVIRQAALLGCERVKLSGGEVLLRADIVGIVEYCTRHGITSSITTNGTLLSEDVLDALQRAGLSHLALSLDSADPIAQDRITGVAGAGLATLSAILRVLGPSPPRTQRIEKATVALVVHALSAPGLAETVRWLGEKGVSSIALIRLVSWHLRDARQLGAGMGEMAVVEEALSVAESFGMEVDLRYPAFASAGLEGEMPEEFYLRRPCFVPAYHLYIGASGRVSPCCYLKREEFGNVMKRSLLDAMLSDRAAAFRLGCLPPVAHDICRLCSHEVRNNMWLAEELASRQSGDRDGA